METAWAIVGIVVPLLVGGVLALVGLTPPEFRAARICLWSAALILGGVDALWQFKTDQPFLFRVCVGMAIWGAIGAGVPESLRWIARRQKRVEQSSLQVNALKDGEKSNNHAPLTPPSTQPHATASGDDTSPTRQSPIERLSQLGWTVKPMKDDIQFEVANRPLPEMQESATYFKQFKQPFNLYLQGVKSIEGLKFLKGSDCTKIEINAGDFTDLSDLKDLNGLTTLIISQTPISGLTTVNISPLASLTTLRELNLGMSKVTDLRPIASLTKLHTLNLIDIPARDLSPLANLTSIQSLDIRGSGATDMSPLAGMNELRELGVDGKQTIDLRKLSQIQSLTTLRIIDQRNVDLSAVGSLLNLESIFIWGPPKLDLSPLRLLPNVKQLTIQGLSMGGVSILTDVEAISSLKMLKKLTLGSANVNDLRFVSALSSLEEINIGTMPVASIEALRGLRMLTSVSLNQVPVVDISPLLDLPALSKLSIIRTPARADVLTELERRGVTIQR